MDNNVVYALKIPIMESTLLIGNTNPVPIPADEAFDEVTYG